MEDKIKNLDDILLDSCTSGTVLDQDVSYLVDPGENYGSLLLKVDIKTRNDNEEEEIIHAVAKCVPRNPITQDYFQTKITFKNELVWYTDIIPELMKFQKEHGINDGMSIFPKFFGGRVNLNRSDLVNEDGVILIENLITSGYKVIDRRIGFDYETTKAVLKALVEFSAVLMCIKHKNSMFFDMNIKPILESITGDEFNTISVNLEFMDTNNEIKHLKERVQKNLQEEDPYGRNTQPLDNPWIAVSHNDFWINNIMVNDQNLSKRIKILDFQFCILRSIVSDLLFVLLTSVELKTIQNHFDEFLNYYYENFVKTLKQFNVDIAPYSHESFLKECNYHGTHGQFSHAFYHIMFVFAEKDKNQKYCSEDGYDLFDDFKEINNNLTQKHIEKYNWLIVEAAKRNWI